MLGGISTKTGYKMLRENKIKSYKIGRTYKISKINIIMYLNVLKKSPAQENTLYHFKALKQKPGYAILLVSMVGVY